MNNKKEDSTALNLEKTKIKIENSRKKCMDGQMCKI